MYSGIVLLLSVFSLVSGHAEWHDFMRKYANIKILSDCFGEEFMTEWYKNYTVASDFCKTQRPDSFLADIPLDEMRYDSLSFQQQNPLIFQNPMGHAVPQIPQMPPGSSFIYDLPTAVSGGLPAQNTDGAGFVDVNDFVNALQGNFSQPILLVPLPYPLLQQLSHYGSGIFLRKKREDNVSPIYDEQKIQAIYQKLQEQTGNFTCVVKRLEIFNSAFDVDVTFILSHYAKLGLDIELMGDVTEGIMDCIKFASCKPLNKMTLTPPIIQRAMTFLKCESKQRVASCVKNDVRKMQSKFDLQALGKLKAGQDVDQGDKMMAILWGEFTK